MTAIIDYKAGNIFSVKNALDFLGCESVVTSSPDILEKADRIILPGVGAFPSAMESLGSLGLIEPIEYYAKQKPFLGICLGMQLLFERSFEFGEHEGLDLIKGTVELIKPYEHGVYNVPHMGWNALGNNKNCALLREVDEGSYVYFVHSYAAVCEHENVAAYCEYGGKIPAVVAEKNIFGCQFHPEKSGEIGLKILKNFCEM